MKIRDLKNGVLYATISRNAAAVVISTPVECACGRMATVIVNRDGKSRCVECDSAYQTTKKEG